MAIIRQQPKGGRKIGVSFTVGEGNEEPICSGYEFLGWKLQKKMER